MVTRFGDDENVLILDYVCRNGYTTLNILKTVIH